MKKTLLLVSVLLLSISLFGCTGGGTEVQQEEDMQSQEVVQQTGEADEKAITELVENFGKKLQLVSLLAPKEVLEKSMKENYGEFVSDALLAEWTKNPMNAPGRLTSSPWPDRIEIASIGKLTENTYRVEGEIIEITSAESTNSKAAAKRPITLYVKKSGNRWLIDDATVGAYEDANSGN